MTMKITTIEPLEARIAPAALATLNLADLNGANGFKLTGEAAGNQTGLSVSSAGDFNGDGFGDLIVGAPYAGVNNAFGAAYVVFGSDSGFAPELDLGALNGTDGFRIDGVVEGETLGFSVSGAGDVNGDGFDDLIIGDAGTTDGGAEATTYVVFGQTISVGPVFDVTTLSGANGFRLISGDAGQVAVAGAGDVNGDGFGDVIVGTKIAQRPAGDSSGAAYVFFGNATGFADIVDLAALDGTNGFKLTGAESDYAGSAVSGAGDINGDGFDDVIVGATRQPAGEPGAAYVFFGKALGFAADLDLAGLNGANGFKFRGGYSGGGAGSALSAAGDLNGDGFADLIVGAPGASSGAGAVHVIYGKPFAFLAEIGTPDVQLDGEKANDALGTSVSHIGDFNGDGFGDVLVGASHQGGGRGSSYVVFGALYSFGYTDQGLGGLDNKTGLKIFGAAAGDNSGRSVSAAGDVNGDGFADLIIGASQELSAGAGAAYVVFGFGTKVTISKDSKTATLRDSDGDLITVKTTKGSLDQSQFEVGSHGGLIGLDFSKEGRFYIGGINPFSGTDLTISATKAPLGTVSDGQVNVTSILADGADLGNVKVQGRLGLLHAGDSNFKTPGVKSLTVNKLGAPDAVSGIFETKIAGPLGTLTVNGDVLAANIIVAGRTGANVGKVAIRGSFTDSLLHAGGNIAGPVTIGGDLFTHGDFQGIIAGGKLGAVTITGSLKSSDASTPAIISALGTLGAKTAAASIAITSLTVGKNVLNAKILAGYSASLAPANADASIGAVIVKGNWNASSLVAGVFDTSIAGDGISPRDGFGQNDTPIGGDTTPTIFATIASITIKGTVAGTTGGTDHFGIIAQKIGALTLGVLKQNLSLGAANLALGTTGDFRVVDFA